MSFPAPVNQLYHLKGLRPKMTAMGLERKYPVIMFHTTGAAMFGMTNVNVINRKSGQQVMFQSIVSGVRN